MYIKYPRTFHLPYSLSSTNDDKTLESDEHFYKMDIVYCSVKMDGENTSVYSNGYIHARSLDGNHHPWQNWLKSYIQMWYRDIPDGYRICGENLYAEHSIKYIFPDDRYYFQMFGIYDNNNICLSYEDICTYAKLLEIKMVDVFYVGKYNKDLIMKKFREYQDKSVNEVEGFVVRNADAFPYEDFSKNVGKFVRANHVQSEVHWNKCWKINKVV